MSGSSRLDSVSRILRNNSPTILSGAAIAGVITTAVLTAKAATKVYDKQLSDDAPPIESKKDVVQAYWTYFIPAGISGAATIACIAGANQIGLRRNAALLGAYTLADTAFREYKEEVLTQIGRTKEQKVRDEIASKQMAENPVSTSTVIIAGRGDQLCYDTLTGRYFQSDIEEIRQAANKLNAGIIGGDMYASQNEFYGLLGLAPVTIGDELGWNLENLIDLLFSSHLADDGRPCLAIKYRNLPRKDYGKF
jgi:hypothetical protein